MENKLEALFGKGIRRTVQNRLDLETKTEIIGQER